MHRAWIWIGRTLLRLVPPFIVVGAAWALLQADAANRVSYVKALTWPVVVLVIVAAFRDPISDRLRHSQEWNLFGNSMKFNPGRDDQLIRQSNAELEREAREVAVAVIEPEPVTNPSDVVDDEPEPEVIDPAEPSTGVRDRPSLDEVLATRGIPPATREMIKTAGEVADFIAARSDAERDQRREAVEDALRAGAKWGYNMAELYASPPEPVIEWDDDGELHITGAEGARREVSPPRALDQWRRGAELSRDKRRILAAEDEVRRLEIEYYQVGRLINPADQAAARQRLKEAKQRLARLDPDSHLLA